VEKRRIVHLVYPHGERISTPDAIGREVGSRLEAFYEVRYHDWDSSERIAPAPGEVLLGHPSSEWSTCFRRSMRDPRWAKVLMLCPYAPDPRQVAFLDPIVRRADGYLAITGKRWFDRMSDSDFAHWRPKMVHIDLAVDRDDFPFVKRSFGVAGERRFAYIGHTGWWKNTQYLTRIAQCMPEVEFSWFGTSSESIPGLVPRGVVNFAESDGLAQIADHDFMVTVGTCDANPTTILEAMAWGLIPVCTPESGYEGFRSIVNIPGNDVAGAVAVLQGLNWTSEERLHNLQEENLALLQTHFNWDRVAAQVRAQIESTTARPMGNELIGRRFALRWSALTSPNSPIRLHALKRTLARLRERR
jgi:hypothetical protein